MDAFRVADQALTDHASGAADEARWRPANGAAPRNVSFHPLMIPDVASASYMVSEFDHESDTNGIRIVANA